MHLTRIHCFPLKLLQTLINQSDSFRAAFHSILNSTDKCFHTDKLNTLTRSRNFELHHFISDDLELFFPVSLRQEHVGCFCYFFRWRSNFAIHIQKCISNTRGQQNRRASVCDGKKESNEIKNLTKWRQPG